MGCSSYLLSLSGQMTICPDSSPCTRVGLGPRATRTEPPASFCAPHPDPRPHSVGLSVLGWIAGPTPRLLTGTGEWVNGFRPSPCSPIRPTAVGTRCLRPPSRDVWASWGLPVLPAPSGATWLLWDPLTLPSAAPTAPPHRRLRLTRSAPALPLLPCLGVLVLGVCCLAVRGRFSPASGARVVGTRKTFPFPFPWRPGP